MSTGTFSSRAARSHGTSGTTASPETPTTEGTPAGRILLVEDDPDLAVLMLHLLGSVCPQAEVTRVPDGEQALEHLGLGDKGPGSLDPRPDLVLLDMRMPGLTGPQVLDRLRAQPATRYLPVVVVSSSNAPKDLEAAYAAGATGYVVKPSELAELRAALGSIARYWLGTNRSPPSDPAV